MTHAINILLVEDDEGHARLIEKDIRRAGVNNTLQHFKDGSSILAHLKTPAFKDAGPSLMLLDLNLPDMTGADILEIVKTDPETKTMPIIVLTTTDNPEEMRRCYALGCNIYLVKPVQYEAFSNAIQQMGMFISIIQVP